MPSRHQVDMSTRIDQADPLGEARLIEVPNQDPVAAINPEMQLVAPEPYLFDQEVIDVVNIAIALGRPLLLQGDPGCGKTRLAHAVAGLLALPIETAYIKSTTQAQDLLYTFDAVNRLYEAQLGVASETRSIDPRKYVKLGPFGRAIVRAGYGRRSVVLIDEIDKADLDFPNDLLRELDLLEFEILETGETFKVDESRPELRPILFVTNNEEKALPPAFLRRCIYLELRFPDDNAFLAKVLAVHDVTNPDLRREVVRAALDIRKFDLSRQPGISEVLDWARILQANKIESREVRSLPAAGALIKAPSDQNLVRYKLTES
jgi:MoxR-like ATPase